eukprot:8381441-Alexandrium_andersonii.AAC.1
MAHALSRLYAPAAEAFPDELASVQRALVPRYAPAPAMTSWCQSPHVQQTLCSRAWPADVVAAEQIAELRSPIVRE